MEVDTRTILTRVTPLSQRGGEKLHFPDTVARRWIEPVARVLGNLGSERAWVVHGADGLDELTTTDVSYVAELADGRVRSFEVTPEDAGLSRAAPEDLKGGDPGTNAAAMRAMLDGEPGPFRDVVLYNAAAALIVAGRAGTLKDGVALAAAAIDGGKARAALEKLVAITNSAPAGDEGASP